MKPDINYSVMVTHEKDFRNLEKDIMNILYWFKINHMAVNPAKFQIMFLGTNERIHDFYINNIIISASTSVKLLV